MGRPDDNPNHTGMHGSTAPPNLLAPVCPDHRVPGDAWDPGLRRSRSEGGYRDDLR